MKTDAEERGEVAEDGGEMPDADGAVVGRALGEFGSGNRSVASRGWLYHGNFRGSQ